MIIQDPDNLTNNERELLEDKLQRDCSFGYPDIDEIELHGEEAIVHYSERNPNWEEDREKSFYIKKISKGIVLDPDPDEMEEWDLM
jgi:hypothetical protein